MLKIHFFIILAGLFACFTTSSQEIIRSTIGAAGSSSYNNGLLIIQTIGQPPGTNVLSDDLGTLRQGFQQPIEHPSVTSSPVVDIIYDDISGNFSIYPNPASDIVNIAITADTGHEWEIHISNVYGKAVFNRRGITDTHVTISLNSLNSGVYFITVISGSERSTRKLIIL